MSLLFSFSCSAVVGGGLWAGQRVHHAAQRVAAHHLVGDPPSTAQRIRELAIETARGGPGVTTGTGALAGIPLAATPDRAGDWDPATVAALQREGIDVGAVNEIRSALRDALTSPDPALRLARVNELRAKYGLNADPALLGRLDRIDADGRMHGSLTGRGRALVASVTGSIATFYHGLVAEVDR